MFSLISVTLSLCEEQERSQSQFSPRLRNVCANLFFVCLSELLCAEFVAFNILYSIIYHVIQHAFLLSCYHENT